MTARSLLVTTVLMTIFMADGVTPMDLKRSVFDQELNQIRYETAYSSIGEDRWYAESETSATSPSQSAPQFKRKSPAKAFFLSLAVPGLGQFYYGSKVKPLLFLSAEVTVWLFYDKWHGEGNDLTDKYEAFNREHWYQSRYEDFLQWTYHKTDDDSIPGFTEHLPDTRTQQYYEMTGKYDQFAWGWDDAALDGDSLYSFDSAYPPPRFDGDTTIPYSARRFTYEGMRNDANNKYDRATRMIIVSLANRLISAFEAYFITKSRNNKINKASGDFARLEMKADLKSYYTRSDTPFFTLTYKF